MEIGKFLKQLRKEKNATLDDVATRTGMSASLISQIENDKASPSLNSLQVLLRFYGVGLSAFFNQVEKEDYLVIKKSDADTFVSKNEKITLTFLASKLNNTRMISYRAEMEPNSELSIARLDGEIQGERFIYLINGPVDLVLNDKEHLTLKNEDSIIFKSHVHCRAKNTSTRTVKMLISGTPPLF